MLSIFYPTFFICCWAMCVLIGCSKNSPSGGGNGEANITAKGVTTTPSGKKWASVDVQVASGAASDAKIKLKTDAVSIWPIIGYGGSVPEMTGADFKKLNDVKKKEFTDAYFSSSGLDYNMLRVAVHATFDGYVFDNVSDDFDLKHFDYNLTGDKENGKFDFIKSVLQTKKETKVFGSAWSPPSWMKLGNHSMNGSPNPCLKEDGRYHKAWADYLVKWVDAYEKLGVPIWAITQQNEPQNYFTQNWATCIFEPKDQMLFIGDYLGPAIKKSKKSTKLFFNDDDKNFLPLVADMILGNKTTAGYVDGAAVHWYTFDQYNALKEYKQKHLKSHSLISTEATNGDPITELHYKTDWDRAMHYAHGTIVDFVYGGSSAFVDWTMTGDTNLIAVKNSDTFVLNTPYYVFGQITKYFKPGYHLLTSLDVPDPGRLPDGIFPAGIEAMAAINPDRTEIVLTILFDDRHESNATISEFLIELDLGRGQYSSIKLNNIEQRSVTTIVMNGKF